VNQSAVQTYRQDERNLAGGRSPNTSLIVILTFEDFGSNVVAVAQTTVSVLVLDVADGVLAHSERFCCLVVECSAVHASVCYSVKLFCLVEGSDLSTTPTLLA